ncbi:mfsd6b [Symbiodinium pilosum]|uniref:Mfsd6b protein n=1 Tax=Symbiodinium pilosum TaxID=2952 RepID=A0A812V945_SYMPI|nr:mfsd6b [Symbiodinium pilosum]
MTSTFSKVGGLIDDDEEERRQISLQAQALYKKAQDAYSSQGSKEHVLRLFEDAEAAMRPLLGGGLATLEPQELETVLKGRLHQAVSLAQMTEVPNRWSRVKSLSEDVLQFDFNNAHARWLRGLCLRSQSKMKEAEEECRRAVECARSQGKDAEAQQWEKEISETFDISGANQTRKSTEERGDTDHAGSSESSSKASKKSSSAAMQKGFLNRPTRKTEVTGQRKGSEPSQTDQDGTKAGSTEESQMSKPSVREAELERELEKLRTSYEEQEVHLHQQIMSLKAMKSEEQHFRDEAEALLQELESQSTATPSASSSCLPADAQAALQVATDRMQAGRAWAENEQQRYVEFSTEVLTLQEMSAREFREQEDVGLKQSKELRELAKRFGDLLRLARLLDGYVRERSAGREQDADVQQLAQQVADFRGLSWTVKISAMVDDGAILRIFVVSAVLGMLFTLAVVVETGLGQTCSLTCGRAVP